MDEQKMFLVGDTVINLEKVMDVAHPPSSEDLPDDDMWAMVMLQDGCFTTIRGRAKVEAFMQAMDEQLGQV